MTQQSFLQDPPFACHQHHILRHLPCFGIASSYYVLKPTKDTQWRQKLKISGHLRMYLCAMPKRGKCLRMWCWWRARGGSCLKLCCVVKQSCRVVSSGFEPMHLNQCSKIRLSLLGAKKTSSQEAIWLKCIYVQCQRAVSAQGCDVDDEHVV